MSRAILVLLLLSACDQPRSAPLQASSQAPQNIVQEFGKRLKNVSLLAPKQHVADAIRANYSDLVEPALLAQWLRDPSTAPGRRTSSPWPDRIDIQSVDEPASDRVTIVGFVVEMSSTGEGERTPIDVTLQRAGARWLICSVLQGEEAAANVVVRYYAAIASHDFKKAYVLWGGDGPPGQSFDEFVSGFRDTATVSVTTGAPSHIGAAAGSRYVDVPVVVNATAKSGAKQRFEGTYTLRRAVVDGATPEQRAWHIYRASLRPAAVS